MIRQHEQTDADITLLYTKVRRDMELSSASKHTHAFLNVGKDGRISDMEVNPNAANYDTMYMNVLLIKRTLLMHLVDGAAAHGEHDINRELIQPAIKSGSLKVYGYEFEGYYRRIETIKSYFRCNIGSSGLQRPPGTVQEEPRLHQDARRCARRLPRGQQREKLARRRRLRHRGQCGKLRALPRRPHRPQRLGQERHHHAGQRDRGQRGNWRMSSSTRMSLFAPTAASSARCSTRSSSARTSLCKGGFPI